MLRKRFKLTDDDITTLSENADKCVDVYISTKGLHAGHEDLAYVEKQVYTAYFLNELSKLNKLYSPKPLHPIKSIDRSQKYRKFKKPLIDSLEDSSARHYIEETYKLQSPLSWASAILQKTTKEQNQEDWSKYLGEGYEGDAESNSIKDALIYLKREFHVDRRYYGDKESTETPTLRNIYTNAHALAESVINRTMMLHGYNPDAVKAAMEIVHQNYFDHVIEQLQRAKNKFEQHGKPEEYIGMVLVMTPKEIRDWTEEFIEKYDENVQSPADAAKRILENAAKQAREDTRNCSV